MLPLGISQPGEDGVVKALTIFNVCHDCHIDYFFCLHLLLGQTTSRLVLSKPAGSTVLRIPSLIILGIVILHTFGEHKSGERLDRMMCEQTAGLV